MRNSSPACLVSVMQIAGAPSENVTNAPSVCVHRIDASRSGALICLIKAGSAGLGGRFRKQKCVRTDERSGCSTFLSVAGGGAGTAAVVTGNGIRPGEAGRLLGTNVTSIALFQSAL